MRDHISAEDRLMTSQLKSILGQLHQDESGQDLIEYALVAALIALAAVAGMSFVASAINNAFSKIGSRLSSAVS
jgi:pilus assembly protein Flp/PilA